MTRRTDFLHRPPFGWRLTLLPLIVIPWAVYLNVGLQPSPAHESTAPLQEGVGQGEVAVPAPIQGVDGKGNAYLQWRDPPYPLVEFRVMFTKERR